MTLTQAELESFHQQGFLVRRGLCKKEWIEKLRQETEDLHEAMSRHAPSNVHISWEEDLPSGSPPRIRQLMCSEVVCPTLDALSRDPELLSMVADLMGPNVLLFHSKLLMKAKRNGSFTPWHQDWGYWRYHSKLPTHINCMLAIDPMEAENGCIRFVPGSHLWGAVEHQSFPSDSFSIGISGDPEAFPSQLVPMDAGDAVFFGPLILHCSSPNLSQRDRRANTFAFDRPGNQLNGELPSHSLRLGSLPASLSAAAAAL
ncbi:MAG TPA: phytanoyl-CoA dioxygenase family protein [Polyangiaceae bacterium]